MSQTLSSQRLASRPIRVLIIQPDHAYEVRVISQDLETLQRLVGGCIEAYHADHCTFWMDREGKLKDYPTNSLATYLWWNLAPEMEGRDVLQGTVFVTGPADEDMDSLPVSDAVIQVFENVARIAAEHGVVPPESSGTTGTTD